MDICDGRKDITKYIRFTTCVAVKRLPDCFVIFGGRRDTLTFAPFLHCV